ncbi:MAG TPA: methionine--tRNA ligase, partial [Thermofilum sp.]|nr:methionine--tRNA ligase [Thermofilum sp.]
MSYISFDEFKKVELKVGKIVSAERIPGTTKLLRIEVDLGAETRQLVAG